MKKQYLFCPGPVHVLDNVKQAAIERDICHREAEFSEMLDDLQSNLLKVVEIRQPENYQAVVITGSSSAANEMVISTVVQKGSTLVITNGEFGNRLQAMAEHYSQQVHTIAFDWGEFIDVRRIESFLTETKINTIVMVHHETSVGILNPVAEIGQLAAKYNCTFIVDTVSSVGSEKIDMESWNIDFIIGTAGKALAAFPGLAFIIGKVNAFEALRSLKNPTIYLNLIRFYDYGRTLKQTPNTPSVQLFMALNQSLKNILEQGVEQYRARTRELANRFRAFFTEIELELLVPDTQYLSSVLTTLRLPEGMSWTELQEKLRQKNIVMYGGKGPLIKTHFQVSNIGDLSDEDMEYCMTSLRSIIKGT